MTTKTVFIKCNEETRKSSCNLLSFESLYSIFCQKFADSASVVIDPQQQTLFYIKDRAYGIDYEIEDYANDIYEGAVIEVRYPELGEDDMLQKELNELNSKIRSLQDDGQASAKRRKLEQAYTLDENAHVVRIRGLPWGADESVAREFFQGLKISPNGISIVTDWQDRPNGEAYVQFETEPDCNKAKQRHNDKVGARYIEVFPSSGTELYRSHCPPAAGPLPIEDANNVILKLRGLPYGGSKQDVLNFFHGTPIEKIHMTKIDRGTLNGEAYVEFKTEEHRDMALKYDREKVGARYIELFKISHSEAGLSKYWV